MSETKLVKLRKLLKKYRIKNKLLFGFGSAQPPSSSLSGAEGNKKQKTKPQN